MDPEPTHDPYAARLARELDRVLELADEFGCGTTEDAARYAGTSAVLKMAAAGCNDVRGDARRKSRGSRCPPPRVTPRHRRYSFRGHVARATATAAAATTARTSAAATGDTNAPTAPASG